MTSQYDLALNPPYQINYRAKRAGKHISMSKRRVTFQFGFSCADAVAAGRTGGECRSEEHEVVLVWSHVTGKRRLCMDGREVHASQAARGNTMFEFSWPVLGGHVLKIIAHGTSPQNNSGQRQFDLELDGMSFFMFKQIYELGCSQAPSTYSHRGLAHQNAHYAKDGEEDGEGTPSVLSVDLFDAQPQPATSIISPVTRYSPVPSLIGSLASLSTASYDEFLPVETREVPKSFESVSNEILCAYNNVPPATVQKLAPGSTSSRALVPVGEEGIDQVTKSMLTLVNLDDITTEPVQSISQTTPSLSNSMRQGPPNWALVGRAPTLSEIRDSTTVFSPTVVPAEPMHARPTPAQFYQGQPLAAHQNVGAPSDFNGQSSSPNLGYAPAPAY